MTLDLFEFCGAVLLIGAAAIAGLCAAIRP